MKRIESTQNTMIKELAKLHRKKERDRQNRYLIEGEHMLQEAAQAGLYRRSFFLKESRCRILQTGIWQLSVQPRS